MGAMHVLVIPVEGEIELRHIEEDNFLDEVYAICGEPVDMVRLRGPVFGEMTAWVNDVGLLIGLPYNERLMALASVHGRLGQPLVGPCVVTGGVTPEGDDEELTEEQMAKLISFFIGYEAGKQ